MNFRPARAKAQVWGRPMRRPQRGTRIAARTQIGASRSRARTCSSSRRSFSLAACERCGRLVRPSVRGAGPRYPLNMRPPQCLRPLGSIRASRAKCRSAEARNIRSKPNRPIRKQRASARAGSIKPHDPLRSRFRFNSLRSLSSGKVLITSLASSQPLRAMPVPSRRKFACSLR